MENSMKELLGIAVAGMITASGISELADIGHGASLTLAGIGFFFYVIWN